MGFDHPWLLLLLVIALPLFVVLQRSEVSTREILHRFRNTPPSRRYYLLRYALALVFAGSLVVVAANPYIEPRVTGDFLFLVDTSRSMEARNSCAEPTFLERSKEVMRDVMEGVPEARFAIMAFDRLAFPITQLTYDHAYLEEVMANGLFIGMSYRATGTNIANALAAVARKKQELPGIYGNVRYVILMSDGHLDNEEWQAEMEEPYRELQKANIRILSVGIGNPDETPIPVTVRGGDCRKDLMEVDGQAVRIPFRADIMKLIAGGTHGEYFEEGQIDELIGYLREETLTGLDNDVEFSDEQRNNIGWIFLIPATVALFGFLLL
jgi:hypothetical protein